MVELNFVVEGQTEEGFVNQVLHPHLLRLNIALRVRVVHTSRTPTRSYRGGVTRYAKIRRDLNLWLRNDKRAGIRFTTMFDFYRFPRDLPGYSPATEQSDPRQSADLLQSAWAADIGDNRFIPYIQLHEFEALVLSDPRLLVKAFPDRNHEVEALYQHCKLLDSPELIDDTPENAPSKLIARFLPEYAGRKASAGPLVAGHIGVEGIRLRCARFNAWLSRLESLAGPSGRLATLP